MSLSAYHNFFMVGLQLFVYNCLSIIKVEQLRWTFVLIALGMIPHFLFFSPFIKLVVEYLWLIISFSRSRRSRSRKRSRSRTRSRRSHSRSKRSRSRSKRSRSRTKRSRSKSKTRFVNTYQLGNFTIILVKNLLISRCPSHFKMWLLWL